jgi:MFS family permease
LNPAGERALRHDVKVISVVGLAHSSSHFFQLALPPLFPLLKAEFGVSYAALGMLVGVFYVASGLTQFAAGFVVDRFGGKAILLAGMALLAGGCTVAGLAPGVAWLYPIVALMGIGNGVFHPADFSILNGTVTAKRLGPAYSTHGVSGNLGWALAPLVSFGLGEAFGWRAALGTMGAGGLAILAIVVSQRGVLGGHRVATAVQHSAGASWRLLRQPSIVTCFAFFVIFATGGSGVQTFLPTVLDAGFAIPLTVGATALTAYFLGSTAGMAAGGVFATWTRHHERIASAGLLAGALLVLLFASWPPIRVALIPMFALIGFALGTTGPSRDLIVRGATPAGASGRVYGFVYSGFDIGSLIGPLWFGFLLDHGLARDALFAIAGCFLVAIATVMQVRRVSGARVGAAR